MNPISYKRNGSDFPIIQQEAEEGSSLKRRKTEHVSSEIFAATASSSNEVRKPTVAAPEKKVNVKKGTLTTFVYNSQGLEEQTMERLPSTQSSYPAADVAVLDLSPPPGGALVRTTSIHKGQMTPPPILAQAQSPSPQKKSAKRGYPREIKRVGERIRPYRRSMTLLKKRLEDLVRTNAVLRRMWTSSLLPNSHLKQAIGNAIETLVDHLRDPSNIGREEFSDILVPLKAALIAQNDEEGLTEAEVLYAQGYNKMPKDRILDESRSYSFQVLEADQLTALIGLMDQFFIDPKNLAVMKAIAEGKSIC